MPVLLLLLLGFALSIGVGIIVMVVRRERRGPFKAPPGFAKPVIARCEHASFFHRPNAWLAIKSRNLLAVQSVLGLHNVKSCSWFEGIASDESLFVAPPVNGWILVMGAGLPDPSDDVDASFRFVREV